MSLAAYQDQWCPHDERLLRYSVEDGEVQRWHCPTYGCEFEYLCIAGVASREQVFPITTNPHNHKGLSLSRLQAKCPDCYLHRLRWMAASPSPFLREQAGRAAVRHNLREFEAFCLRLGMPLPPEVPTV